MITMRDKKKKNNISYIMILDLFYKFFIPIKINDNTVLL